MHRPLQTLEMLISKHQSIRARKSTQLLHKTFYQKPYGTQCLVSAE